MKNSAIKTDRHAQKFTDFVKNEDDGYLSCTIDTALMSVELKHITQEDAEGFVRWCSHVISGAISLLDLDVSHYRKIEYAVVAYDHMKGLGLEPNKSVSCGDLAKAIIETHFEKYLSREYKPASEK